MINSTVSCYIFKLSDIIITIMTSISQSECASSLNAEQLATKLSQLAEPSLHERSISNREQSVPPNTPNDHQSVSLTAAGQKMRPCSSHLGPPSSSLTTVATEVRLKIYDYLFYSSAQFLLRRRAGVADESVIQKLANSFDCSVLFTCRKLYNEALPIFYASQTFHYPPRSGAHFTNSWHLMVNLSMHLKVVYDEDTDAVLSRSIINLTQRCPKLRTLTIHLHLLPGDHCFQDLPADSATGRVLRQLQPSLDSLSIIALGESPVLTTQKLRRSITEDKYWSNTCISNPLNHSWPNHLIQSQWTYLTIPDWTQYFVHGNYRIFCASALCRKRMKSTNGLAARSARKRLRRMHI